MFSELEDFNDLGPSLVANENYQEIVPVPDNPDSLFNDDLFSVEISSSCLDDGDAAQSGKLRIRNLFCPAPELPINIPNILPSTEELHAMPPNVLDNQGDLTTTKSAGYFCVSSKYRADVRLGLMPVPVCGPASPLQQSSPGYGIQGYYLNVEFSRLSKFVSAFLTNLFKSATFSLRKNLPSQSSDTFLPRGRCFLLSILETIRPSENRVEQPCGFRSWDPLPSPNRVGVDRL